MLTFGDHIVSPWYSPPRERLLFRPRASVDVASPIALHSERLSDAATPMICGKLVATPSRATPCSASLH